MKAKENLLFKVASLRHLAAYWDVLAKDSPLLISKVAKTDADVQRMLKEQLYRDDRIPIPSHSYIIAPVRSSSFSPFLPFGKAYVCCVRADIRICQGHSVPWRDSRRDVSASISGC